MDSRCGVFLPCLVSFHTLTLDNTCLIHVDALLNHVELDETAVTLVVVLDSVQLLLVKTVAADGNRSFQHCEVLHSTRYGYISRATKKENYLHITNVTQPTLQGSNVIVSRLGGTHTSALVVTADDNVWNV